MTVIQCKMCGGDMKLSADKTFGTCEYCGRVTTLPKVEEEQAAAAFNRGNQFRRKGEFDRALAVYEHILEQDGRNAEAHWCCALCRFGIEYVQDPDSGEWFPTCHRLSFDSFLEDVDYLAALEYADEAARSQYRKDAEEIAQVQRGILATSRQEEPFDVFLCYKESEEDGSRTKDSVLAQEIYYELTEEGHRVFFARITLEDKAGVEYEPYIFAALQSAKVMVVLGTTAEHFSAVWVKNEWSRFLSLMKKDRSKLLIPCYRDMDPYDLPEQLSILQAYDMGKIGFLQDLIRGIDKVLGADGEEEKEKGEIQGETGSLSALLKRGELALEDGEWQKADGFFEQALNLDAENGRAYLGKFLAEQKCPTLEALARRGEGRSNTVKPERLEACPEDTQAVQEAADRYAIAGRFPREAVGKLFAFDRTYPAFAAGRQKLYENETAFWKGNKLFHRALKFSDGELRDHLEKVRRDSLHFLEQKLEEARIADEKAKEQARKAYEEHLLAAEKEAAKGNEAATAQMQEEYEAACKRLGNASKNSELEYARKSFLELGAYRDSQDRAKECTDKIRALQELERQAVLEETKRRKKKLYRKLYAAAAAVVLVFAAVLLTVQVVVPTMQYSEAEAFAAEGEKGRAAVLFGTLGGFRDSRQRSNDLWNEVAVRQPIAAGYKSMIVLPDDRDVYVSDSSIDVSGWEDLAAVSAGWGHVVGLRRDGTVVAAESDENWSWTSQGQCNVRGWKDIVSIAAGDTHTVGLKVDGTVVAAGNEEDDRCDVSDWKDIVAVSAGDSHTVGLKADGTVVAAGDVYSKYYEGQCAVWDWEDITAVAAGGNHTVGLKADGTVVAVGSNDKGQCDVAAWRNIVAISAGTYHTVGLKADGTVVAAGNNYYGQCNVSGLKNVSAIASGSSASYTLVVMQDGEVVIVGQENVE